MATTLAFDVYGTLVDTQGIMATLQKYAGPRSFEFSRTWREKQLEYSFRRGLMQNYEAFSVCTSQALDFTCSLFGMFLNQSQREELLDAYKTLPAFKEVREGLASARRAGFRLFAFSNGSGAAIEGLLNHAGIREYFLDVVSVDEVRSFKPNPGVYAHFMRRAGSTGSSSWLISSNPFDVIGAMSAGMRGAWVQRAPNSIFDPWGITPNLTVSDLLELSDQILETEKGS